MGLAARDLTMANETPRLIGRKEAAAYLGIAESTFSMWVATHKMPQAIYGTRKWDKRAIDAKLDEISGLAATEKVDPYEKWMREHGGSENRKSSSYAHGTDVALWRAEKEKRRAKYKPQMGLSGKLENALMFMAKNPECDTAASIPGTGQMMLDELIAAGAVRLVGTEKQAFRYALTEEGAAEAARIKKWRSLSPD